jgi:hypothetical protein
MGKYMFYAFYVQNYLKQLLFLECAIRKAKENQKGLGLNGTHHILVYAADVNLFSRRNSINTFFILN